MATPAGQAKAQALNIKIESEARIVIDQIEKNYLRQFAKRTHQCAINCYDKASTTGPTETLQQCVHECQYPQQQASNLVQQEITNYQNRLNRKMQDCQDSARDIMVPGWEQDAKKVQKVEDTLLSCMSKTVEEQIKLLHPLQQRIAGQLKQIK